MANNHELEPRNIIPTNTDDLINLAKSGSVSFEPNDDNEKQVSYREIYEKRIRKSRDDSGVTDQRAEVRRLMRGRPGEEIGGVE